MFIPPILQRRVAAQSNPLPPMNRSIFFLLLSLCSLGCGTIGGIGIGRGEPPAAEDATPPPDYSPVYLRSIGKYAGQTKIAVQVNRVNVSDPTRVKMEVQMLDSNGTFLAGASEGKLRSIWCRLEDTFDGRTATISNFTLREIAESERRPLAVAVVMDHSGSMGEERARRVQEAAARLIDRKKPEDALAFVKYDAKIGVEAPPSTDQNRLRTSLGRNGLDGYGGLTAINDGIAAGIESLAGTPTGIGRAVVIFTDGVDNSSTINVDSVIRLARRRNVSVCTVDFGDNIDPAHLERIAVETGGSYRHIYGTGEFDIIFDDIYRCLRNAYILEYPTAQFGRHEVRLVLCNGRDSAVTTAIYDNTPDIGSIGLLNVQFDYDKAELKPESNTAIDNVVTLMRAIPTLTIELRGHTDNSNRTGDPDYNRKLSQRRAEAVRNAIIAKGIGAGRITAAGYGDTMPVADNSSADGRAQNRRTEFAVTGR